MSTKIRLIDALERLVWTFVAAFLSSLVSVPILVEIIENSSDVSIDLSALRTMLLGALVAGLTAVANSVIILARWRLSVLPDPGAGLPGSRIRDAGFAETSAVWTIVGALAIVALALWIAGHW